MTVVPREPLIRAYKEIKCFALHRQAVSLDKVRNDDVISEWFTLGLQDKHRFVRSVRSSKVTRSDRLLKIVISEYLARAMGTAVISITQSYTSRVKAYLCLRSRDDLPDVRSILGVERERGSLSVREAT